MLSEDALRFFLPLYLTWVTRGRYLPNQMTMMGQLVDDARRSGQPASLTSSGMAPSITSTHQAFLDELLVELNKSEREDLTDAEYAHLGQTMMSLYYEPPPTPMANQARMDDLARFASELNARAAAEYDHQNPLAKIHFLRPTTHASISSHAASAPSEAKDASL